MERSAMVVTLFLAGCRIDFDATTQGAVDAPGDGATGDAATACAAYVPWTSPTSKYRLLPAITDWAMAEATCQADGAHLATVGDASENADILAHAADKVWIGTSDRVTEGTFLLVTGGTPGFSNWPGAPPANTGEDCVQILLNGDWEDDSCITINPHPAACECDGVAAESTSF